LAAAFISLKTKSLSDNLTNRIPPSEVMLTGLSGSSNVG